MKGQETKGQHRPHKGARKKKEEKWLPRISLSVRIWSRDDTKLEFNMSKKYTAVGKSIKRECGRRISQTIVLRNICLVFFKNLKYVFFFLNRIECFALLLAPTIEKIKNGRRFVGGNVDK
ncbi:hypothetical protein Fot_38797 [Forsythia ovata]|uniref:Uncharacterized protein n=1 Tax=Forsythia ovata TaxID=205694 RepID=A0ABD1S2T8_9LAMI